MTQVPLTLDHATGDVREMTAAEISALGGGAATPTVIASSTSCTVAAATQVLWRNGITVNGSLVVNGSLQGI